MKILHRAPFWLAITLLLLGYFVARFLIAPYPIASQERLVALDANSGQVVWIVAGQFTGRLAVDGDRVFVQKNRKIQRHFYPSNSDLYPSRVVALDAATGRQQWQTQDESILNMLRAGNGKWLYVNSGSLYHASFDDQTFNDQTLQEQLFVRETATGKIHQRIHRHWVYNFSRNLGIAASEDRLIFATELDPSSARLQALETATAKPIWEANLRKPSNPNGYGSYDESWYRADLVANDRTIFFKNARNSIDAYDIATGKIRFSIPASEGSVEEIQADDKLLYRRNNLGITAFDALTKEIRWKREGTATNDRELKENPVCKAVNVEYFLASFQRIYAICNDAQNGTWLSSLNANTGEQQWLQQISPVVVVDLNESSLPLAANLETVFVETQKHETQDLLTGNKLAEAQVYAFSAQDGIRRWRFSKSSDIPISRLVTDGDRVFVLDEAPRWRNWLTRFNRTGLTQQR